MKQLLNNNDVKAPIPVVVLTPSQWEAIKPLCLLVQAKDIVKGKKELQFMWNILEKGDLYSTTTSGAIVIDIAQSIKGSVPGSDLLKSKNLQYVGNCDGEEVVKGKAIIAMWNRDAIPNRGFIAPRHSLTTLNMLRRTLYLPRKAIMDHVGGILVMDVGPPMFL